MKLLRSLLLRFSSGVAAVAMAAGAGSVAKACWFIFNQPKVPEGMQKFIREDD
ncbi:MAG: cyclic lactone autoinducer peptide [Oscillospiraceae bacterium]|nr:cyclic lactone autoinducer peptide [Oscillospiraceae bacterium]